MALFDYIVEGYIPKKIIKADPNVSIKVTCHDKDIVKDKKFIAAVNREYKKFPLDKHIAGEWGSSKITAKEAKKYMTLDVIDISDGTNGPIVEIWFNAHKEHQSEEFYGGHSATITLFFDNNYNLIKSDFSLEG